MMARSAARTSRCVCLCVCVCVCVSGSGTWLYRTFRVHPHYRGTLHVLLVLILIVGTYRLFYGRIGGPVGPMGGPPPEYDNHGAPRNHYQHQTPNNRFQGSGHQQAPDSSYQSGFQRGFLPGACCGCCVPAHDRCPT